MADALEKLKKKRRTYRATTTKTVNKIDDILKQEDVDVIRIQQLLSDIREKLGTLKELDDGILEIMFENNDDEACEKEAEEANEIREKVTYNIFLLEEALKKNSSSTPQTKPNLQRSSSLESVSSIESSTSSARGYHRKVKLPQLELKKFSGNIPEWQEFWDGFKSAIHDDEDLAKVDKFKYLRCYLEEPARSVITGFALTDANYDAAVDLLTKRFGKTNVIKRALINDLINLPAVFSEKNANRLRNLHDQIETKFRAMEAQEIDKESYSSVVVPVLMSKIPESIRNNMIRFGDNHMEWNLGEMLVAFEKELDVLEGHFPIMNQPFPQTGAGRRAEMKHHSTTTTAALLTERENPSGNDNKKCLFCHAFHESTKCQKIKDPEDRKKILVKTARCFVCLKQGHRAFKCKLRKECSLCRKNDHHVSICPNLGHVKDSLRNDTAPSAPLNPQASSWVGSTGSEGGVALQTALAVVNDKRESKVRVLFDTGSHKTFITEKAVCENELRPVRKEILGIKAFGSREADVAERDVVELSLSPLNGGKNVFIEAFVVKDISSIPNIHVESVKHDYEHLKHVWFSDYCRKQDRLEIDCLIGSDWIWSFQEGRTIRGGQQEPVAVETSLGWVLSGPLKGKKLDHIYSSDCQVNFCIDETSKFSSVGNLDLDYKLNRLWDLDSIGIREANKVHEGVLDNIKFTGHRYSVGLPWKLGHKPLPTNYNISMLRMKSQVRKLRQTPIILKKYDEIISQQVEEGIIEQVAELEPEWKVHYLPHRAVIRENAETTKLRIVYDASCKDRKLGVSLNDCLHVGPSLTPMILDVLLRFRINPVALVGDIEKAFLNIEIHKEDRDCLRFLWYKDINDADSEVIVYRFNRVVFGCNSSPFLLNCVLRNHIEKYKEEDPEFVSKLIGGFFVDDLVTGCKDSSEAVDLYRKAKSRMKDGGFTLRKWKTNSSEVAKEIADTEGNEMQVKDVSVSSEESYAKETLGLDTLEGKTKVLGISWEIEKDRLDLDLYKVGKEADDSVCATKRGILSTLASLYDPLGLISPVVVTAKILFQELCLEKLGWDDTLPQEKVLVWQTWLEDLRETRTISFPRCVLEDRKGDVFSYQLHGFADASQKAYCAMVYLVCVTEQRTFTKLLSAKTRVAPLKPLSIPRLELMSARVLATLMDTVKNALSPQIQFDKVKYWLDSKTALFWIYNNGEWKQFVHHRVNEILSLTSKEDWAHVAGTDNPADLGSRGVSATLLKNSRLWWEGPTWLCEDESKWPKFSPSVDSADIEVERRKNATSLFTTNTDRVGVGSIVDVERHGTLGKLLRVTAFVLRFINNLRGRSMNKVLNIGNLSTEEIEAAEHVWIKDVQKALRNRQDFQALSVQLGIVDQSGVLVCKGRLENADLDIGSKYPIIIPKDHRFTDLVIEDCHKRVFHNKLRSTLAELRSRFWVPRGRQQVKRVLNRCLTCKWLDAKALAAPNTAPLPDFRVAKSLPFSNTGIDFAGPLFVKTGQGDMRKAYIALFTCCVARAIHLELIDDLNTLTFMNCFRRFCSRRGTPRLINTENAKTFKAANKLLNKLAKDHTFVEYLVHRRIKWKFNLPLSPWWGGYFERMVGSVKRCLRKVLKNARLSFDELHTVLTEVENILNSRPLTYLYDELETTLTPSHLIYGYRLSSLSEGIDPIFDEEDIKDKLTKRFCMLLEDYLIFGVDGKENT